MAPPKEWLGLISVSLHDLTHSIVEIDGDDKIAVGANRTAPSGAGSTCGGNIAIGDGDGFDGAGLIVPHLTLAQPEMRAAEACLGAEVTTLDVADK